MSILSLEPDFGPLGSLAEEELVWMESFDYLEAHGYLLRPRYRPGWRPSWKPGEIPGPRAEDAFVAVDSHVLDAIRTKDNLPVILKRVDKSRPEISIAQFLTSEELRNDPQNHCVPLLEVLYPGRDPTRAIMVIPLLRRIDIPPPFTVRECLEFTEQTLEGLNFMHKHQVAHRDLAMYNVMMDARPMFPKGWHAQEYYSLPSGKPHRWWERRSRSAGGGVRYYFIDFGISSRGEDLVTGIDGQERAPELSDVVPYDPYKLDVYTLGKVFETFIINRENMQFLQPLVSYMTTIDPAQRPTAAEAMARYKQLRSFLSRDRIYRRSPPKGGRRDGTFAVIIKEMYYHMCEGYWALKFLVLQRGSSLLFTY